MYIENRPEERGSTDPAARFKCYVSRHHSSIQNGVGANWNSAGVGIVDDLLAEEVLASAVGWILPTLEAGATILSIST